MTIAPTFPSTVMQLWVIKTGSAEMPWPKAITQVPPKAAVTKWTLTSKHCRSSNERLPTTSPKDWRSQTCLSKLPNWCLCATLLNTKNGEKRRAKLHLAVLKLRLIIHQKAQPTSTKTGLGSWAFATTCTIPQASQRWNGTHTTKALLPTLWSTGIKWSLSVQFRTASKNSRHLKETFWRQIIKWVSTCD